MKQDAARLDKIATEIRQNIIKMLLSAGSGHSAGPMGMADVFCALYFAVIRHDPHNPTWPERDRVILSNGHICPVWYATLAQADYFSVEELSTLRKINSRLQGHPHLGSLPGIENTGGPLGQGTSVAVGLALSALMDQAKWRVWCLTSDGEHDEGQVWEAVMLAAKYKLHNLTFIIDRNNIQIDGFTENVMPLEPLKEKYEAFGWHVLEVDGHNIPAIIDTCQMAQSIFEKPTAIIAHTIPGKGVDFMESKWEWHGKIPNKEQAQKALSELRSLQGQIEGEHQ